MNAPVVVKLPEDQRFNSETEEGYVCEWGNCIDQDVPAMFEVFVKSEDVTKQDHKLTWACIDHIFSITTHPDLLSQVD